MKLTRSTVLVLGAVAATITGSTGDALARTTFTAKSPLNRSYVGPSVTLVTTPHANQTYNLFLPTTPAPPNGYPVVIQFNLHNFTATGRDTTITSGFQHEALSHGIAVVSASCTTSPASPLGVYPGNGVFVPPLGAANVLPPGYTAGAIHPYYDPARPMPERDAIMVIQHVRSGLGFAVDEPIDLTKVAVSGGSAGANTLMWCVFGPDRKNVWRNPQGQELESTRVDAAVLRIGPTYWPVYVLNSSGPTGGHFPVVPSTTYDVPGTYLQDTDPQIQLLASPLYYALDEVTSPGITALNDAQAAYMSYGDPTSNTDFSIPFSMLQTETLGHTAWSGFAWKTAFPWSRLTIDPPTVANDIEDQIFDTGPLQEIDQVSFLLQAFAGTQPGPWYDLGFALAGGGGAPTLVGTGTMVPGTGQNLALSGALPSSTALLATGLHTGYASFHGGILVPTLDLPIVAVPVDGSGNANLPFTLNIATPPTTRLNFQFWINEGGGVWSASNGVQGTSPP